MMPNDKLLRGTTLRPGMTGVKIPRHVGTWKVRDVFQALDPNGSAVDLFVVEHERLARVSPMVCTSTCAVVLSRIPAMDVEAALEKAGYRP